MSAGAPDPRKERLRSAAFDLGFVGFGVTSAAPLHSARLLADWIAGGRHGRMDYLERQLDRRTTPKSHLAEARSVIVCAYPYGAPTRPNPRWRERLTGRIAAYAAGGDYHDDLGTRLASLAERLGGSRCRIHVDAGPLVEKELARRAGIGWYGHNTNLLIPSLGSTFVLGCIVTDVALTPDEPFEGEHCGTCRACVPACPTGALAAGPTIDARLCISYLTIELRGPIPHSLRPMLDDWVFGCDDCQSACPWTDRTEGDDSGAYPDLLNLLAQTNDRFLDVYGHTAVARTKRVGLARNAAVALGNSGNPAAVPALARALREDPSPLVAAHCAWALGRIGGAEAARELRSVSRAETPLPVAAEVRAAIVSALRADGPYPSPEEGIV